MEILSRAIMRRLKSFTPSCRDVHPNPLRVSSGIVPSGSRVSHTEPSHSCLHLQRNLVRPLSLTEELRLCQNIEHYQLSI
jgi:hypothetical protein